ncbi:tRNA threonylcarbamoyl adenosine modification protein TsaB like protein, partial [Aduncisulcus paluster]
MRILAIDTSSQVASAAIIEEDKLLGEMTINHPRTHSQKLMPIIQTLCESLELKISDMDMIAVAGGPGSFTGVRIGLSAAKALAHPFNLPVVMISSLRGLAYNLPGFDGIVCPVLDARRGEVYTAAFRWQGESLITVIEDQPLPLETLLDKFKDGHAQRIVFLGDAAEKFK